MPKKIVCKCHEPIGISKKYKQPWSDVYISWTDKPGRKKYRLAPCLVSKPFAEADLKTNLEIQEKYKSLDFQTDIDECRSAIDWLENFDICVHNPNNSFPNIYTSKDYIDRHEAEKMIAELMKFYGYQNIKCKWKRVKLFVIPM